MQQSIAALEASVDEKIGSIDISSALSHIKQYDFVVDSNETLLAWADCTDGSMKSVLVKSGEYTLDGKMINLVNAGTKFVFAEPGNKITVSNYTRGIGATENYGAIIVGLNVDVSCETQEDCFGFYRGMFCYNCTGSGRGGKYVFASGFFQCTCCNCTGTGICGVGGLGGNGFCECTCSNCTGTGTGTGNASGFNKCTCSNCNANANANSNASGFNKCTCSNCNANATGRGISVGFLMCTCSNCTGTGTGNSGYSFYDCKYCSSCRVGSTASTTKTWGGTNTYIDSDSCDYVAA